MTIDAVFGSPLPDLAVVGVTHELRSFQAGDAHVVAEASSDSLIPLITTVPANYSDEEGLAFVNRQHHRRAAGEGWSLAIVHKDRQLAVGQIGLWISHLHKGRAEIGYWVAESGRGLGAAAEAVELLAAWAFANLTVNRLSLFIEPWNTASIKTAEHAGFDREALLRNWESVGGMPKDMWSYVKLPPAPAD